MISEIIKEEVKDIEAIKVVSDTYMLIILINNEYYNNDLSGTIIFTTSPSSYPLGWQVSLNNLDGNPNVKLFQGEVTLKF